jgi:hypothetical protein
MKAIAKFFIARDIKRYFGFLFDKGYKIQNIRYHPESFGNWGVVLESPFNLIYIFCDREEIFLSFAPVDTDHKDGIGIEPMIYFLSQEQNFIGSFEGDLFREKKKQFEKLADLLKEYLDQITPYFGSDFLRYKNELLSTQKKYNDTLLKRYAAR